MSVPTSSHGLWISSRKSSAARPTPAGSSCSCFQKKNQELPSPGSLRQSVSGWRTIRPWCSLTPLGRHSTHFFRASTSQPSAVPLLPWPPPAARVNATAGLNKSGRSLSGSFGDTGVELQLPSRCATRLLKDLWGLRRRTFSPLMPPRSPVCSVARNIARNQSHVQHFNPGSGLTDWCRCKANSAVIQ